MKLKIDFHTHTDLSLDGVSTFEDMVRYGEKRGLDGIAITDHNISFSQMEYIDTDILLIPGCEISTLDGHIVGVFLKASIDVVGTWGGSLPSAMEAVDEIHNKGGIAILAHPFAKKESMESKIHLAGLVDAVEVKNARACFKNKKANDMAKLFADKHKLTHIAGSDGHSKAEVGNAYTVVSCKEKTLESLEEAVRLSKTDTVLVKDTPHIRKGISQFTKILREGKKIKIFKGVIYLIYCLGKDVLDKIKVK